MDLRTLQVNSCLVLLMIVLLLLLLIIFINRRSAKRKGLKVLPPAASAWKIIGMLFFKRESRKDPHIVLADLAQRLGPIFSLKIGSRLVYVASNVEAAREVYKVHDRELSGRFTLQVHKIVPPEKNTLIAMAEECNQRWKQLRGISHSELFSSQALESQSKLRVEKVREMLAFLNRKEESGQVVGISDVIFTTLSNSLSMYMTSRDMIRNWENIGEAKEYMRSLPLFARPAMADLYPFLASITARFSTNHKALEYRKIFASLWGDILVERRSSAGKSKTDRQDLLDVLIKCSWEDSQILEFLSEFFGSMDSTTTTTEWAMAELIKNEEALVRLREELLEASEGGRVVRECNLTKLSYFQACIKETLRLHPPLPFLAFRAAVETCKLMNFDVPKGCLIMTNAYALGRDANTWKDPLSFKPERFLGETSLDVKGANYQLLPFGSGRRICVGYPWALKHIQLILASMVLSYDWFIPGQADPAHLNMDEKFGNVLHKDKTLLLILKKRTNVSIE